MLLSLFKAVASLSHENSAPENGFSINKFIEALRMVKDTILNHGSIFDVPITNDLLESVKLAKQLYKHDLENKRKLKEAKTEKLQMLAKKYEEKEITEKVQQVPQELHSKVRQTSDALPVADDIVKEGNDELKNCLSQKTSTRKELERAHSKIETDTKRRQELSEEQQVITKRIEELEHKRTEIL